MGDVNWTVRASEEIKNKISGMIEGSGLPAKDFLEAMVTAYEMQQVKEHRTELTQDLDELEKLTRRICSIYIGMAERIDTTLTDKEIIHKIEIEGKDGKIKILNQELEDIKFNNENLTYSFSQVEAEKADMQKNMEFLQDKIKELEAGHKTEIDNMIEANNTSKAFIQELQNGNNTLLNQLSEYKTYKDKVHEFEISLKEAHTERDNANATVEDLQNKINDGIATINALEDSHIMNLKSLASRCEMEKDKALIEQEKALRTEMQEIRDKYNSEISGYASQIKELLGKLELKVLTADKKEVNPE